MAEGRVFQISMSKGGVPKLAVHRAEVTEAGLTGDKQRNLQYHGGPDRALCLYSLERILGLQAEGHPIFPGATGENLTLSGIPWEAVRPGVRLDLGAEVRIEITSFTAPCPKIGASFREAAISRMSEKEHPGWSRLYARVLAAGSLQTGDSVRIVDDSDVEV